VFGVLDNVGGLLLTQAFSLLDDGGSLQSIGMASNQPSTIDFEQERRNISSRSAATACESGWSPLPFALRSVLISTTC
jgi:NADPH:quinone reductase-like Zn-dependent oxidoreductase